MGKGEVSPVGRVSPFLRTLVPDVYNVSPMVRKNDQCLLAMRLSYGVRYLPEYV